MSRFNRHIRTFAPIIGLILFLVAIYVIYRELEQHPWHEIRDAIHGLTTWQLALGLLFSATSYVVLAGYDMLGARYIKRPLPLGRNLFATFTGYAFSNTVGHALVTGGSVRLRLYSSIGFTVGQISVLMLFNVLTYWIGFVFVSGAGLLVYAPEFQELMKLPIWVSRLVGAACLLLVLAYLVMCLFVKRAVRIKGREFRPPSISIAVGQLLVSTIDLILAAAVLWVALPDPTMVDLWAFLTVFAVGQTVGHMSLIPGGLGVFDGITLAFLSRQVPAADALAAILAFRVLYNLLPLLVAALMLGANEVATARAAVKGLDRAGRFGQLSEAVPSIAAAVALVAGGVVLMAAAAPRPSEVWRLVPVIESRTFQAVGGALVGLLGGAVLVCAAGLQQRRRWSWRISVASLVCLGVLGVALGEHMSVCIVVLVAALAITLCRADVDRPGSPLRFRTWRGWAAVWAMILVLSGLVAVLAHRQRPVPGAPLEWGPSENAAPIPLVIMAALVTSTAFAAAWGMRVRRIRAMTADRTA